VPAPVIAPLSDRFDGVGSIAVLRGGGLGDLLFVLPAVDALAAAYPDATVTLLGTRLAREVLSGGRSRSVAAVELLPPMPGVHDAPERSDSAELRRAFTARMRDRSFSLIAQMHGGGRHSNPFVLALGAEHSIGLGTADAEPLERTLDYVYYQQAVMRFLEVAALAGAAPVTLEPILEALPADRLSMAPLVDDSARGLVVIHPGATDPRRRWPASAFADVAGRLAADGYQVIVVGDHTDVLTAGSIVDSCRKRHGGRLAASVTSLAGKLSLSELIGLLWHAAVVVANDSGPRHLAAAIGRRTVGIFWVGNVINAGPLGRGEHRIQMSWTTRCPVCGRDSSQVGWTAPRCPHDVSFVADVDADSVYLDACALLRESREDPRTGAAGS
jgi:ADP-heptose:LPS heptosyltransferase